jgi:hypothetical protein
VNEAQMNNTPSVTTRRNNLDWLRILAVLLLIPFHTARLFDFWEPNYVKNAELSAKLTYQIAFIGPRHMPLFFLFAGAATWYALDKLDLVRDILISNGRSLAQGALTWLWARNDRRIPIPGFRTSSQVEENIKAFDFGPLTNREMEQVDELLGRTS